MSRPGDRSAKRLRDGSGGARASGGGIKRPRGNVNGRAGHKTGNDEPQRRVISNKSVALGI